VKTRRSIEKLASDPEPGPHEPVLEASPDAHGRTAEAHTGGAAATASAAGPAGGSPGRRLAVLGGAPAAGVASATGGAPGQPAPGEAPSTASPDGTAVDPVCGMTVRVDGSMHTHEFEGRTFHFCCNGCRTRFAKDPARYLIQAS
jgi:P-type Cu+ transporter